MSKLIMFYFFSISLISSCSVYPQPKSSEINIENHLSDEEMIQISMDLILKSSYGSEPCFIKDLEKFICISNNLQYSTSPIDSRCIVMTAIKDVPTPVIVKNDYSLQNDTLDCAFNTNIKYLITESEISFRFSPFFVSIDGVYFGGVYNNTQDEGYVFLIKKEESKYSLVYQVMIHS